MFLVCDPIIWGLEHVPFNTAFLKIIRLAFPNDEICFYGEASHVDNVQKQIGIEFANSIIWGKLVLPPRHSSFFNRLPSDFKIVRFLLNKLNKNPTSHVLVITGIPSLLWALKFLIHTVHKDKNIQVILHGVLGALGGKRSSLKPHVRIQSIRPALRMFNHRRMQYIILEEPIRDAVLQKLPSLHDHIGVLDHPTPLDERPTGDNNFNPPIQFGFLGLANEQKGFLKYIAVASEISAKFPGLANFHFVGRISEKDKYLHIPEIAFLSSKPGTERLNRDEYVRCINKLHFVCLFCDKYYEFSPSGVLLDSIAWEKPIIATQLPIFKNIESKFGDIGYLCKNGEFSDTIGAILRRSDTNRYKRQVLNMRRVKSARTPETLARKYRELVKELRTK